MNRIFTAGAVTLVASLATSTLIAQQPAPAGPQPFTVGNALGMPINPAPDGKFRPDVEEREGVRRDLLGRELLVRRRARRHRGTQPRCRAERADQQRVDLVHQP
jgi:hypothetical protein